MEVQFENNDDAASVARFVDALVEHGILTAVLAERVSRIRAETNDSLASTLLKLGLLSEEELAIRMAEFADCRRLKVDDRPSNPVEIDGITPAFLRSHDVVPIGASEDALRLACWDATDTYADRALEFATGLSVIRVVGTRTEVEHLSELLYPLIEPTVEALPGDEIVEQEEFDRLKDLASDAPIIRLVQRVIDDAVQSKSSDIHFETLESELLVRLRQDGMLHEVARHPKHFAAPLVSRVKVLAGLNIAERRLPQDGRIRITVQGKEIDFRVSTSPTLHGESLVLRILDKQDIRLDLGSLGFSVQAIDHVTEAVQRPHGIVLVTGPTGSGKTTTLYAALSLINKPDRKILTVEDPVEYVLPGINQVPIKPQIGLTFAHALRSFLRQDPDVMMVGEVRDRETAETAIQAALTGHLLLSTLHTNSAAGALTRLLDMGIDDFLLTSTLHLILGQRLVRVLCTACRASYEPSMEVLRRHGLPEAPTQWFRARGCPQCRGTGYQGRTTILEVLRMSDAVRATVLRREDAHAIERAACAEGMQTLIQHGMARVAAGTTSLEEVLRVTSLN